MKILIFNENYFYIEIRMYFMYINTYFIEVNNSIILILCNYKDLIEDSYIKNDNYFKNNFNIYYLYFQFTKNCKGNDIDFNFNLKNKDIFSHRLK